MTKQRRDGSEAPEDLQHDDGHVEAACLAPGVTPENPQISGVDLVDVAMHAPVDVRFEHQAQALQTQRLLDAGVAQSTLRARRTDVADWEAFMALRGEPALPVGEGAIADFAAQLLISGSCTSPTPRPLAVGSVERRIASVSSWSAERGHGRVDLAQARRVIRGYRRTTGGARPLRAAPITVQILSRMLDQLALDEAAGHGSRAARDRALVTTAFCVAGRRSEVASLRVEDIAFVEEGAIITVTRRKTRELPDDIAVPLAADSRLCAVRAISHLLDAMGKPTSGPLFRRVSRSGAFLDAQLQAESVSDIVTRLTAEAHVTVPPGFRGFSGHSLRRGAVSAMRAGGADVFAIAKAGGWSSNSRVLGSYVEDADQWRCSPLVGLL